MTDGLRVVTFNVYPPAYGLVAAWARDHGHEVALLVTLPSQEGLRYGPDSLDLPGNVPDEQDLLVTNRLRTTAAAVIESLRPDLIVAATLSRRIPVEVTRIPRYGALNLHTTPLPRGRGPNPARTIYDGEPTIGVTLHRIEPEFDAGAMLARIEEPLGEQPTGAGLRERWLALQRQALDVGVPRAVAGEWGEPQPEEGATYAARFSSAEHWLRWDEPAATIERRVAALGIYQPTSCAMLEERRVLVVAARAASASVQVPDVPPGTVLQRDGDTATIRAGDGLISVAYRPLS